MPCNKCNSCNQAPGVNNCGAGCNGSCEGGNCPQRCHEVVETYADLATLKNAFVTVRKENAVYHLDDIGNPVCVSRSAIYKNNYTPVADDYRQNVVYDFVLNKMTIFNTSGAFKTVDLA